MSCKSLIRIFAPSMSAILVNENLMIMKQHVIFNNDRFVKIGTSSWRNNSQSMTINI